MTEISEKLLAIMKTALWGVPLPEDLTVTEELKNELRAQAVEGLAAAVLPGQEETAELYQTQYLRMEYVQQQTLTLLQEAGIPVVVLKGTASGIYYPDPTLRTYGDIDLLVRPEAYPQAKAALQTAGWTQQDENSAEASLTRDGFELELHRDIPGISELPEGEYLRDYLFSGLADPQTGMIRETEGTFPMLPWRQNGLELIWHVRRHLYNGLGLRQIMDWMLFVHRCLGDEAFGEYEEVLRRSGLLTLARTVTRMCQLYLGLPEELAWCRDADPGLCAELMDYILDQGNFGHKRRDDKGAKVLSRYRTPLAFLRRMQQKGEEEWPAVKAHPALRPFAWLYSAKKAFRFLSGKGWRALRQSREEAQKRQSMFDRLY